MYLYPDEFAGLPVRCQLEPDSRVVCIFWKSAVHSQEVDEVLPRTLAGFVRAIPRDGLEFEARDEDESVLILRNLLRVDHRSRKLQG